MRRRRAFAQRGHGATAGNYSDARYNAEAPANDCRPDITSSEKPVRGFIACLLLLPAFACGQQAAQGEELEELLGRIGAVELRLERDLKAQHQAEAELREAETRITRLREAAGEVQRKLESSRSERARLADALEDKGQAHRRTQQELAAAMRRAWRSGRQDNFKALLGGRSTGDVNRRLAWAGILLRSWSEDARESIRSAAEVRGIESDSMSVEQQLVELQAQQAGQLRGLEQAMAARRQSLAALRRRIGDAGEEIERLRTRAATLASLVEDLGRIVKDHPSAPLLPITEARGRLDWPVRGRVVRRFGAGPGGGQASWDGILLEAQAGAEVRAPHPGRVVFADWVRGLGFLMVLDHGENVLSLYAYNDRLLGRKGEMVSKGQVIAHAGSTGGRREPGLYFEIRRNGKAVDPLPWLSR